MKYNAHTAEDVDGQPLPEASGQWQEPAALDKNTKFPAIPSISYMDLNAPAHPGGHSALVRMRLQFAGQTFRISQMGEDFLFVEATIDHPPAIGRIELQVDAAHRAWEVFLPEGMCAGEERVELAAMEPPVSSNLENPGI